MQPLRAYDSEEIAGDNVGLLDIENRIKHVLLIGV